MERHKLTKIPKIIWQTHEYEYEDLPYPYNLNSLTWQNINTDFEYRYASASKRLEDIKMYEPKILDLYISIHSGVTKADIWRYVILREFGGIYADLDSVCLNNLNKIDLNQEFIYNQPFGQETCVTCNIRTGKAVLNGFIGAVPKNKIFDLAINSFLDGSFCSSTMAVCSILRFSKAVESSGIDYSIGKGFININSNCQHGLCHKTNRGLDVSICHGDWHKNNYKDNIDILEHNSKKITF